MYNVTVATISEILFNQHPPYIGMDGIAVLWGSLVMGGDPLFTPLTYNFTQLLYIPPGWLSPPTNQNTWLANRELEGRQTLPEREWGDQKRLEESGVKHLM